MPYIKNEDRKYFEKALKSIPSFTKLNAAGQLNYLITKICMLYISDLGGESYSNYNDIIGALECCKQELYRRKIAPYENTKIKSNGEVY